MNILLITEQRDAQWNKTSFETLAAAQQMAAETKSRLAAVVIGKGVAALAGELAANKLDEVLLVEHDLLAAYTPDGYTVALKQVIAQVKPDLAKILRETPLSAKQHIKVSGEDVIVVAAVRNTPALRRWILGHGPAVEVLGPATLRTAIGAKVQAAAARY
jgi:electron transfer flavoprotein alpha subunit